MSKSDYTSDIRPPENYSDADLDAFAACVRKGGKVGAGIRQRLPHAALLGVVRCRGTIIGTAAIKNPTDHHRTECFEDARGEADAGLFPYEFGWAFMSPEHRDAKLISPLIAELVRRTAHKGIYSTTQTTNEPMIHMLEKNGFGRDGGTYRSKLGAEDLILYLREAKPAA
jgi:GNAT superfamily N-acetyltransferase